MKEFISSNLTELRGQIAEACEQHDRDIDDITIIAVTKSHPGSIIKTALACGLHNVGESRVHEAEDKIAENGHIARFHLIGHLQSNKTKKAVSLFDVIQSVDSVKLANDINQHAAEIDRNIECLLQVNCSKESQKYGFEPDEVLPALESIRHLPNITLAGLMTIGPLTDNTDNIREAFAQCRELFQQGKLIAGDQFDTLSMGMSDDFHLAIAEGSTMIRIGSRIFGSRPA